jgi:DinB superfamily
VDGKLIEIIEGLEDTPRWLAEEALRLASRVTARPAADQWSYSEVVAHVSASASIVAPRIAQILVRPGTPLIAFDERRWAELIAQAGLSLDLQLKMFELQRQQLVAILQTISTDEWAQIGVHESLGSMTVMDVANQLVDHERVHQSQARAL